MNATIVTYRVHPGRAEENADRIRAVYAELAQVAPEGYRYATFLREDGLSFVHMSFAEGESPLPELPAFRAFRQALPSEQEPDSVRLSTLVGSYRV
jgi:hypothetical protein